MRKYERWSNEEEEALLGGIEKYGFGKWKLILKDPQFGPYLANRSNIDVKKKCYREDMKDKVAEAIRRNGLMLTHPLRPRSSRKRSKNVVEDDSDSEEYHHQCTLTPHGRGTNSNMVNQAYDYLLHQSPLSSEELSINELVEELCDSEDYHHQCSDTPQKRGTSKNTINHAKKSNSEKIHDDLSHRSRLSVEELSKIELVEELSGPEEYHIPRTITRQSRGARNNIHTRKLNSDQVHTYLENLWGNIPEDKSSSFAHLDPFWYTFYSDNSKKEKVLKWIKNKDPFSRKYVVFPIVHGGHWSVLIFCHFGESLGSKVKTPCILLLDSLEKAEHSKQVEPIIRKFVLDVYKNLEMTEDIKMLRKMPFLVPKVPQQRDKEECGFFVLYYIKLFVENAPESFSTSNGYPYFMKKNWFTYEGLDNFCKTIDSSHK